MELKRTTYIAILDQTDKRGNYWFSGQKRKLFEDEEYTQNKIKEGKIREWNYEAKRIVNLDGVEMTWSEYLKYRYSLKQKHGNKNTL